MKIQSVEVCINDEEETRRDDPFYVTPVSKTGEIIEQVCSFVNKKRICDVRT